MMEACLKVKDFRSIGKILIPVIIIGVLVLSLYLIYRQQNQEGVCVKIYSYDKLLATYDLDKLNGTKTYRYETSEGYNVITISKDCVKVVEGDCPDKVCMHSGNALKSHMPIICAPHGLYIVIEGEVSEKNDAISY